MLRRKLGVRPGLFAWAENRCSHRRRSRCSTTRNREDSMMDYCQGGCKGRRYCCGLTNFVNGSLIPWPRQEGRAEEYFYCLRRYLHDSVIMSETLPNIAT